MNKIEFMNKWCIDCHKECVTNKDINECMKAYQDSMRDMEESVTKKIKDLSKDIDNLHKKINGVDNE